MLRQGSPYNYLHIKHGLYSAPPVLANLDAVLPGPPSVDGPILWSANATRSYRLTKHLLIMRRLFQTNVANGKSDFSSLVSVTPLV